MMKIIQTDTEYQEALKEVEILMESDPYPGTEAGNRLELLTLLISRYEDEHFPIPLKQSHENLSIQ